MKNKVMKGTLFLLLFYLICPILLEVEAAIETPPKHLRDLSDIFETPLVNGNLAHITNGTVQVTNGNPNQVGAVWSTDKNLMDFKKDFHMSSYVNLGDRRGNSADGVMFVIQANTGTQRWFTTSGASLGALADNNTGVPVIGSAIPNSFGIEFDLYGNKSNADGYFDNQVGNPATYNQHIAQVWPGDPNFYDDGGTWYWRVIRHQNPINRVLADGLWIKLAVDWDVEKQQLSYQIDDGVPHVVDAAIFKRNVLDISSTAYWGFTGSTGPTYTAQQQVIFDEVPGLVNAEAKTYIKSNSRSKFLDNNSTVFSTEELHFSHEVIYHEGKQTWKDIEVTIEGLSEMTIKPNSIKLIPWYDDVEGSSISIDESAYREGSITISDNIMPDLDVAGINPSKVIIEYDGILHSESGSEQLSVQANYTGSNAMIDADSFNLYVSNNIQPTVNVAQEENEVNIPDTESRILFSGDWQNPTGGQVELAYYLDEQLIGSNSGIDSSDGEGSWSFEWLDFENISYGEHIFKVVITNQLGQANVSSLPFFKFNSPTLTGVSIPHNQNIFEKGEKIPFQIMWKDNDSESIQFYCQIDDDIVIPLGQADNIAMGEEHTYFHEIITENMSLGRHLFTFFGIDSDGNKSNEIFSYVTIVGKVQFSTRPSNFEMESGVVSTPGEMKVTTLGEIGITDSREPGSNWSVTAQLNADESDTRYHKNFINEDGIEAPDDFLVYKNDKNSRIPINTTSAIVMTQKTFNASEVFVNQDGEAGFYINTKSWMYRGIYTASISWTIVDAP
ncbi:hypothetical protein HB847_14865 [Listeria booriae]|uniref:Legume lectin domain-containing protein n=1 Tax=Listeria booriae TaxID=1552123 RepID=A0A841Y9P2_9LIST|nr:L-type lectin-domain containing protein [Listeria booriae]MBC1373634.1 hypothetical protein [Listeria booriae]